MSPSGGIKLPFQWSELWLSPLTAVWAVVLIAALSFLNLLTLPHFLKQLKTREKSWQGCQVMRSACDHTSLTEVMHHVSIAENERKKVSTLSEHILLVSWRKKTVLITPPFFLTSWTRFVSQLKIFRLTSLFRFTGLITEHLSNF